MHNSTSLGPLCDECVLELSSFIRILRVSPKRELPICTVIWWSLFAKYSLVQSFPSLIEVEGLQKDCYLSSRASYPSLITLKSFSIEWFFLGSSSSTHPMLAFTLHYLKLLIFFSFYILFTDFRGQWLHSIPPVRSCSALSSRTLVLLP
jgi:hypothetical protein